jgi:hypothetical protein
MKALIIITFISLAVNAYLIFLKLKNRDKDNDFIDDRLEVKAEIVKGKAKEIVDVVKPARKKHQK